MAQRNNTWSLHVHVGVRGADRAVAVCDRLRERAARPCSRCRRTRRSWTASDTGLHSVRTEIFTRTFPRCGVHEPFGTWDAYADFVDAPGPHELDRRGDSAVVERSPASRLRHGRAADLRRADAGRGVVRARRPDHGLHRPGGARLRRRAAAGSRLRQREIEENLWRAIRHGMDGGMIDFDRGVEMPARLGGRAARGVDGTGARACSASRSRSRSERRAARRGGARRGRHDRARSIEDAVAETRRTYAPQGGVDRMRLRHGQPEHSRVAEPHAERGGDARRASRSSSARCGSRTCCSRASVSLLNLAARRIAKEDERDLEQARIGIEAVRAVVDLLDPEPAEQVRSALSEVQMLYAKHAEAGSPRGEGRRAAGRGEASGHRPRRLPGGARPRPPSKPGRRPGQICGALAAPTPWRPLGARPARH